MDLKEQWFLPGFLAFAVVVTQGATCDFNFSPQCYKPMEKSTTYKCEWSPPEDMNDATYELFFRRSNSLENRSLGFSNNNYIDLRSENLLIKVSVDIWVMARMGKWSCESLKSSFVLMERVKYGAPQNISMSRSSSNLTLSWNNEKGNAVDVEVRRRENSSGTWNTSEFQVKQAMVFLNDLQPQLAYELQLRLKSKVAKHPLWSDWTPIFDVPTEIQDPPEVNWTVMDFHNGTRLLKLTWGTTIYPVSVGQVNYNLTLLIWPCVQDPTTWRNINSTEFSVFVTYSAVSGSIVAFNKVGKSQVRRILVPEKRLTNSSKPWLLNISIPSEHVPQHKKFCLEWYRLTDGEIRPEKVNISKINKQVNETLHSIRKEMDDFVPYYYLVHKQTNKHRQTIKMCLMYKKEGAPRKAPENLTILSTTNSAMLHWKHIPVSHRQGFLTYYNVCYRRSENDKGNATTKCDSISATKTEYCIQNLTPQSTYKIFLSGETVAGIGPVATGDVMTHAQFPGWIIAVVVPIGILITLCFFYIKRHQSKIFPPVPRPVVAESAMFQAKNQDIREIKEEVHDLQLHAKRSKEHKSEETNRLNVCRTYECEDTDDESLGDPLVLRLGTLDSNPVDTDCEVAMLMYRNGLVFDMKAESTEDVGPPQ